eukprot:GHVH01008778.1.p1 GENE.GHVH01008778.1~~GHVH01008778.1.p1  ORF type:complete len:243 (+),score=21.99 GHVH01008778.1:157-885(+)
MDHPFFNTAINTQQPTSSFAPAGLPRMPIDNRSILYDLSTANHGLLDHRYSYAWAPSLVNEEDGDGSGGAPDLNIPPYFLSTDYVSWATTPPLSCALSPQTECLPPVQQPEAPPANLIRNMESSADLQPKYGEPDDYCCPDNIDEKPISPPQTYYTSPSVAVARTDSSSASSLATPIKQEFDSSRQSKGGQRQIQPLQPATKPNAQSLAVNRSRRRPPPVKDFRSIYYKLILFVKGHKETKT